MVRGGGYTDKLGTHIIPNMSVEPRTKNKTNLFVMCSFLQLCD